MENVEYMQRITKIVSYIFVMSILLAPTTLFAKEKMYWMEAVAPPFFIHEGELKGQGYEDLITDILKENLPQYDHVSMQANISRHYQQWKQGEPACSLAMYKTEEREEFALFSIPSVFTLPPVLIIKKEQFAAFGGKKTVSLKDVLASNNFIIGRAAKRSYGPAFDEILNTYGNQDNLFSYEGPELSLNLFKMLLAGRVQAMPGLPEEAMYLAETMGLRDQIMTLSVKENLVDHEPMLTYVACSKNEWGAKAIAAINKVLEEQRPTERYRAAYERWLDESSVAEYRRMYKMIFLQADEQYATE